MARRLEVVVVGDTKDLERALGRAGSAGTTFGQKVSRGARIAGLALGGVLAAGAVAGFKELEQGQKVAAQTNAVLKSTGKVANVTAKQVDDLSQSLMRKSGVDDEVIGSGQNVLLTFRNIRNEAGKGNDIFKQATEATLDLSVALGKDMTSAAILVGKAMNDPTKGLQALTRAGVQFSKADTELIKHLFETGHAAEAQKLILKELNTEFGGSAEAAGKTLPGQLAIARESFKNMAGELVTSLLPALTSFASGLQGALDWMQQHPKAAKAITVALGALSVALISASAAQTLLNLAVLANPYVAAAAAIIALTTAVVIARRQSETFRKIWNTVVLALAAIAPWLAIITYSRQIASGLQTAAEKVKNFVSKVKDVSAGPFNAVAAAVSSAISYVMTLVSWVKTLISWINKIPRLGLGGGDSPGNPNPAPGTVSGDKRSVLNPRAAMGGGSSVAVNFNGPVYGDPRSIAQAVREEFVKMQRNGSKLGFT